MRKVFRYFLRLLFFIAFTKFMAVLIILFLMLMSCAGSKFAIRQKELAAKPIKEHPKAVQWFVLSAFVGVVIVYHLAGKETGNK